MKFRLRHRDGGYYWFDARATALRDADGRIKKWFGMNVDITDRLADERPGSSPGAAG